MRPFSNTEEFLQWIIDDYKEETVSQDAKLMNDDDPGDKDETVTQDEPDTSSKGKMLRQKFLYKFFEGSKRKRADDWRNNPDNFSAGDKYIYIRSMYLAFKAGEKTKDDYLKAFNETNQSTRSGVKKDREKLLDIDLDKAQDQLEEGLLRDCIDRYIDNAKRSKFLSSKKTPRNSSAKRGENIDVIEMLHEFYRYAEETDYERGSTVSDLYIQRYGKMYKTVKKSEGSAFIPLYIDERSGAGVYIIKGFSGSLKDAKIIILSFGEILEDMIEISEDGGTQSVFPILMNIDEICESKCDGECDKCNSCYAGVKDAFHVLEGSIETGMCFEHYMDYNFTNSIDSIDDSFLPYFDLTDEERQKIMRSYIESEETKVEELKKNEGKNYR